VGTSAQVIACFVVDDEALGRCAAHATRLAFLAESPQDLDASLRGLGGAVVIRRGQWIASVIGLVRTAIASHIHVLDDYSAYAQRLPGTTPRCPVLGACRERLSASRGPIGQPATGLAVSSLWAAGQQRRGDGGAALLTLAVLATGNALQRGLDLGELLTLTGRRAG
jgi:DNA photolyase